MRNKGTRLIAGLLLLVMLMSTLCYCGTQHTVLSTEGETESMDESQTTVDFVQLNGKWNFYKDEKGEEVVYKTVGENCGTRALVAEQTLKSTIVVPDANKVIYGKIVLPIKFGNTVSTENGERPYIEASLNGAPYFRTFIEDFTHNPNAENHAIDFGYTLTDLKSGENEITFRTNVKTGDMQVNIKADDSADASLVSYRMFFFPSTKIEMDVPGTWELQLSDKEAYTAYDGIGWYQTTFDALKTDANHQTVLEFLGVDYYSEIFVNDRFICSHEDGYSKIEINFADYPDLLREYGNELIVRVTDQSWNNNSKFPIKQTLAGFYHDSVGINYAGIWHDVNLSTGGMVRIEDLTIVADSSTFLAEAKAVLVNHGDREVTRKVSYAVKQTNGEVISSTSKEVSLLPNEQKTLEFSLRIPNGQAWEVTSPKLYEAVVSTIEESKSAAFGFTNILTEGKSILFNERPIQLNGILSWLGNWDTLSPRFDPDMFRSQIRMLKAYGFNAIKFCLVVPPEYLLDICDEEGIYVYIEYPVWNPNQTDAFYERAYSQMGRFVSMGKNHPSVILSDFNCEMHSFDDKMSEFMAWCIKTGREIDPCRLFTDNSSTGQQNPESGIDFWTFHPYTNALGFADFAETVINSRNSKGEKPLVFGEYADFPALADFERIKAANGGDIPWNWNVVDDPFRADLYFKRLGYTDEQIQQMIKDSQTNCIDLKMHVVQETKKTQGIGAYFLTIIQDIGHSVAGVFDELGNAKFDPSETEFLKDTVLLMDENVYNYENGVETKIKPAISNYGGTDIQDATLTYTLKTTDGNVVVQNELLLSDLSAENGRYTVFDEAIITMPEKADACQYELYFTLTTENGLKVENHWDVFSYPHEFSTGDIKVMVSGDNSTHAFMKRYPNAEKWVDGATPDVLVAFDKLTPAQMTYLKNGGKVLYLGTGSEAMKVEKGTYYSQYVLVSFPQPEHELIASIPSKGFGGLQFLKFQTQYVITEKKDSPLPHTLIGKVLIRDNVGDIGQSASFMSEMNIGNGQIIQCTLNLDGDKPLGNYLIDQAVHYLAK